MLPLYKWPGRGNLFFFYQARESSLVNKQVEAVVKCVVKYALRGTPTQAVVIMHNA